MVQKNNDKNNSKRNNGDSNTILDVVDVGFGKAADATKNAFQNLA